MSKRLLTVQDLSIVGQCSLGVALPVISSLGVEACGLPSSVLSTHTAKEFGQFVYHDLTNEMDNIREHWNSINITFDGVLTGYVANPKQLSLIKKLIKDCVDKKGKIIIDPVMGDNGTAYPQITDEMKIAMRNFIKGADLIIPNMTEAYLLLDRKYKPCPLNDEVEEMLKALHEMSGGDVIITGVNFLPGKIGVAYFNRGNINYCFSNRHEGNYYGAGDIFASAVAASLVQGLELEKTLPEITDFLEECIKDTNLSEHWYGICFEPKLAAFANKILNK